MKSILILLTLFSFIWAKPSYNIAILSDGDTEYGAQFEEALKTEIKQILGRDYNVKFPKSLHKNGKWKYGIIAANANQALKDNRSDMILALGVLSSHYIARKRSFPKPVIAAAVINPKMQKIPFKNGTSGKYNLTYVSGLQTLDKDIETIHEIMPVKKVAVLIDAILLKNTPEVGRYIKRKFVYNKIEIELIPINNDIETSISKISDSVDFVYVTPLFQQNSEQKIELYQALAAKELPSFASTGQDDVELGALFANSPSTDNNRFIRQIALDVQQIALGASASSQLVDFIPAPALSLNMMTANEIGFTPDWELLSKATIIKSEQSDSHFFNLEEIMNRAVAHNLQVISSESQIDISQADLERADSLYLPQIHIGMEALKIDEDRAIASLGSENEMRVDAYIKFSQQIFNQRATAQISINESFLKAQTKATDFVKLDIGLASASMYLRILQLRTKLKIEKSNLELSKTNMRSAVTRRDIGIGNASDIYRWQTQISGEKKSLLYTHTALQQAKHALNALLDLPQGLALNFDPIDMSDKVFMTSDKTMVSYFLEQKKFAQFQAYLVKTARTHMPSIQQYDAIEKARTLLVSSNENAFFLPDVSVEGGIRQHFLETTNEFRDNDESLDSALPPYADKTDWQVGFFIRFPLYQGGAKTAELEASKAALLVAESQRANLLNEVEKNVRDSLYQAKASFLSIKLAEQASVSSKKNLELIKSVYAQGSIGIVDLLDAQHTALRAALQENSTRYEFMHDLLVLQHNIGQVNFNIGVDNFTLFKNELESYDPAADEEDE